MAASIPIRSLLRHSPAASACPLLLHHHRPATALPPTTVPTLASLFSTSGSAAASAPESSRSVPYNWLKVKRIRKSYKSKGALARAGAAKSKKPNPGDRRNFRKRIVLSNSSALIVPDLPELKPDTMLAVPVRRLSQAEAQAQLGGQRYGDDGPVQTMLQTVPGPRPTGTAALLPNLGEEQWAPGERRDIVGIARGMVALPDRLLSQLRLLEAFKSNQSWGLFRKPHFLVREETVQLIGRMDRAAREKSPLRMIIDGKAGTGKSMLLLQAISHALMNKWVVINIPEAQDLVNGNTEYTPIADTNPMQFSQPVYATTLLERIHDANEALLKSLTVSREYRTELIHVPMGSSLADLAMSAREAESAWPLFLALWHELVNVPGRPPVLLAADGLAHWSRPSAYRDPKYNIVHAHEMALPRHVLSALSPTGYGSAAPTSFPNGGAVLVTVGGNNSPHVPALDLAVRQNLAISRGDAENEIPSRDPYERRYDERVLDSLRGVEAMSIAGINRDEARAVVEYWAASGLLRSAVTETVVSEKWALGGSGVIGEMERATLVNMRVGWA